MNRSSRITSVLVGMLAVGLVLGDRLASADPTTPYVVTSIKWNEVQTASARTLPVAPTEGFAISQTTPGAPYTAVDQVVTTVHVCIATPQLPDAGWNPFYGVLAFSGCMRAYLEDSLMTPIWQHDPTRDVCLTLGDGGVVNENIAYEQASMCWDVSVANPSPGERMVFAADGIASLYDGGVINVFATAFVHKLGNPLP